MYNLLSKFLLKTLIILSFSLPAISEDKIVNLTTLEWPPYAGEKIVNQGSSTLVISEAFKAMGYDIKVNFFPWERAVNSVRLSKKDENYIAYYPAYYREDRVKEFLYSEPIGSSILGFAENKASPITWNNVSDLTKYHLGIVTGYANSKEFDDAVVTNALKTTSVVSDLLNLTQLAHERVDAAVVDKYYMDYALIKDVNLNKIKDKLQFNSKILEEKKLYVCFKNDEEGKKLRDIFNEGLKKINIKKLVNDYISNLK